MNFGFLFFKRIGFFLALCIASFASAAFSQETAPSETSTAPAAAAPVAKGAISGTVIDSASGNPLAAASVTLTIAPGDERTAETDLAGFYRFENVPVGTYSVLVSAKGYSRNEVEGIEVTENQAANASASLQKPKPEEIETLETFKVTTKASENSDVGLRTLRQTATVPVDALSAIQIGKFVGSDVADVMIRLPGVSVARGQFAVIRGLSERYNPVLLDGIVLPSADPERQSPQMDIFPTSLVSAIVVSKAFEAGLPASSSGGALELRTSAFPDAKFAKVQIGVRAEEDVFNGGTFLTYNSGGDGDYLADGKRDRYRRPTDFNNGPVNAILQDGVTPLASRARKTPVGQRANVSFGDRVTLNKDKGRKVGYSFNFGYDSSFGSRQGRDASANNYVNSIGAPAYQTGRQQDLLNFSSQDFYESEEEYRLGFLGTVGYAFNNRNQIALSAFVSQIGIDTATNKYYSLTQGLDRYQDLADFHDYLAANNPAPAAFSSYVRNVRGSDNVPFDFFELYYRQRNLTDIKLSGKHQFSGERNLKLNWAVARVKTSQDEPDFRFTPVFINDFGDYSVGVPSSPGERNLVRSWRKSDEASWIGRTDLQWDLTAGLLKNAQLKIGFYRDSTERTYGEAAFNLSGSSPTSTFTALTPADLPRFMQNASGFNVNAAETGSVQATRRLDAGYASLTLPLLKNAPLGKKFELTAGVRMEDFKLTSTGDGKLYGALNIGSFYSFDLGYPASVFGPHIGKIDERTWHPAFSILYSPRDRLNFRVSYSRTKARPSFREVGPYFTVDQVTDEAFAGNVFLKTSDVENLDLRLEYFVGASRDLISLSVFRKKIANPIERYTVRNADYGLISTLANNPNEADLSGVEAEFTKKLSFLGKLGEFFTLGANGTLIEASVLRNPSPVLENSNYFPGARPLFDQPRWILNSNLTYDNKKAGFSSTLSHFAISDVLQSLRYNLWDSYTESHDRLDLTATQVLGRGWTAKFSVRNIIPKARSRIADPVTTAERIVYSTYQDGRDYSFTLTRDF